MVKKTTHHGKTYMQPELCPKDLSATAASVCFHLIVWILIGQRDLSSIDRNLEWKFEIQNCRGQGPMVIILPAVAETELAIQTSRGDKQWVEGHPHKPWLACLVLFIGCYEDRCCRAWNILYGETYCLVSVLSSKGTLETYFCISSLIDVCLFSVSNVDRALCVILNQRLWDEVIWILI